MEGSGDARALPARVEVEYYTDPLCCWSWALEAEWRRLRWEFGDGLRWRYRMGGMIPDWNSFGDPLNSVQSAAQMGPHWFYVARVSGTPIDARLWTEDPPASSYPASVAFKAAERQGAAAAEAYLRRLREAAMLERRNVARRPVLLELAEEVADAGAELDAERFRLEMADAEAVGAFREDLKQARYLQIGRFPALLLRGPNAGVGLVGFRPYEVLRAALHELDPALEPVRSFASAADYAAHWGSLTAREMAAGLGIEADAAASLLAEAVASGELAARGEVGRELFRPVEEG